MILYLRVVPGFGITVEMSRLPELRSRPVVLGGLPHQRGTVREASFLAQQSGVRIGMALSQAHQQCPDAAFLTPDLPHYEAVWEEICSILGSFTPVVEPLAVGQAVCDLSGCERHWKDVSSAARAVAAEIRRCGIIPWLGVASNRITAELASTVVGEEGITVVDCGRERAFLADMSIDFLPDVDPRMALTFQALGLKTIGQLAELPAGAVKQRFGTPGERLHTWARGIDLRPILPPPPKPVVVAGHTCDEGTIEEATELIHRLSEECAAELRRRQLAGRVVTLKLWWKPATEGPGYGEKATEGPGYREKEGQGHEERSELPVAYRIHSMLPQPGNASNSLNSSPVRPAGPGGAVTAQGMPPVVAAARGGIESVTGERSSVQLPFDATSAVVRTPIDSAPPLADRAGQLLVQRWPRPRRGGAIARSLQALSLEISEFEQPAQLAFVEIDRIGESGGLRGMDPGRLQTLLRQEEILATRYGDPTFRHVTHVDPSSVLAERRFRWNVGLSLDHVARPRRKR
jgi:DNA polymerase IV